MNRAKALVQRFLLIGCQSPSSAPAKSNAAPNPNNRVARTAPGCGPRNTAPASAPSNVVAIAANVETMPSGSNPGAGAPLHVCPASRFESIHHGRLPVASSIFPAPCPGTGINFNIKA